MTNWTDEYLHWKYIFWANDAKIRHKYKPLSNNEAKCGFVFNTDGRGFLKTDGDCDIPLCKRCERGTNVYLIGDPP